MKIKTTDLEKLILKALKTKYSVQDSKKIAEVIMFGELSGKKSHGLVRLIKGGSSMLAQNPDKPPEIVKKSDLSSLIESHNNPGMLIGYIASEEVIRLANKNGFGLIGTMATSSTSGCLSFYAEKIAKEGLICIIMPQSPPGVAPFNSSEALFGTNPIAFGIPSSPDPFIFDMGTSAISWGALLKADATNSQIEKGVAVDSDGNETTDPKKAMEGAVLPFDKSYKSSGLSMIVEILGGMWPLASFAGYNSEGGWGSVFMAMKPDLLQDLDSFRKNSRKLIEKVRNSKTRDGQPVRIPGENTLKNRDMCLKNNEVDVADELIEMTEEFIKDHD